MKKPKAKRVKGTSGVVASVVLPAGTDVGRESIMRNVENLIASQEDRRQTDDSTDEDEADKPPPSTQAFGVSGLSARFGGKGKEQQHSTEDDDLSEEDSASGPSTGEDDTEDEPEPEVAAERPRTSLWGLAGDTSSTQLTKAGDEKIVSHIFATVQLRKPSTDQL